MEHPEQLLAYCKANDRVCPQPQCWNKLWNMPPGNRRKGAGLEPPLPLIRAAWWDTPLLSKVPRFQEHVHWAAGHGAQEEVGAFLRSLPEDQWHHGNDQHLILQRPHRTMPDKEIYSTRLRAGRRTYFLDVKEGDDGHAYLKITESRKTGEAFEQSRIVVDKEHAEDLLESMADAVRRLMAQQFKKEPVPVEKDKAYSVEEKREKHPQAYARWTKEDDVRLEQLFCGGKKNKELAVIFGRDPGAIAARIKKLELREKYGR